jgi:hypothetical protein
MAQATELMKSTNPSDQLRGMQLMLQVQNTFTAISNFINTQAKLAKEALDNSRLS